MIYPPKDEGEAETSYPRSGLILKLKSSSMPHKLVGTLEKKAEAMIKKMAAESPAKPQVLPVFDFLLNIMLNNNLIPAWSELPEIKGVLRLEHNSPAAKFKDEIKLFEKQGKLKLKLRQGKAFFLDVELSVPANYPYERPELKFLDHNYDKAFARIFFLQADQVMKRLWQGGDAGYLPGDMLSNERDKHANKKAQGALEAQMEKLKVLNRAELKHDVEYLNMATDLRSKAEEGDKKAKKLMKLKMKHEAAYEEETQQEEAEMQRIAAMNEGKLNTNTAKPSLFQVVDYLANYFVRFLPTAKCLGCNEKLVQPLK
jgi:hypothetical protein